MNKIMNDINKMVNDINKMINDINDRTTLPLARRLTC